MLPALRRWWPLLLAAACALPGVALRFAPGAWPPPLAALAFGLTIGAAAFVLAWATEAAEQDLSRGVALALLALAAVLPEYAVDGTFAWLAGRHAQYLSFPLANMTGANRILIGWGWPLVLALAWGRRRARRVALDRAQRDKVLILLAATIYSFWIVARHRLGPLDTVVLLALFAAYLWRLPSHGAAPPPFAGVAARLAALSRRRRRWVLAALALAAACAMLWVSEAFAQTLVATGRMLGVNQFLLVQWLAPAASELPEFVIVAIFAWRAATGRALEALVSSKVNQWTLLVAFLPLIFSASRGHWAALPLSPLQEKELLLTAAQSLLASLILLDLSLHWSEALALWVLFTAQLAVPHWREAMIYIYFGCALLALILHRRGLWDALRAIRHPPMRLAPPSEARGSRLRR